MANDIIITIFLSVFVNKIKLHTLHYILSSFRHVYSFPVCFTQRVLVMLFPGRHLKLLVWTLNTIFNCLQLKTGLSETMYD